MGMMLSRILSLLRSSKPCRILMIGLDAAGKTTILYNLKLGEVLTTIPTIGFNVETVEYKNISFTVWDMGGQKLRPLWNHYSQNASAIIYVVDSGDDEKMAEAREELEKVLESDEVAGVPLLVMANKCDLPTAMSVTQITEGLNLKNQSSRPWFVQPTCALKSEGIYEAMDWLAKEVSK